MWVAWTALWLVGAGCRDPEQPPDLGDTETYGGPGFKLRYPGNWKFKTRTQTSPLEFRIESTGGACSVDIDIDQPPGNYRKKLQGLLARRALAMPEPKFRPEFQWGSHGGQGVRLEGKLTTLSKVPGYTLVFAIHTSSSAAHIIQTCPDQYSAINDVGFDFIARTFDMW